MVEKIWRPGRLIGNPDGLQFAFTLTGEQCLAWGEGMVFLAGEPVWFAEGLERQEIPLEWTWVDLLAFLGRWWPWLMLEEDYPLPVQPLYPAFFLREVERRLLELSDDQAEEEEELAHRFIARHDLAEAFTGLFLPSLILLRQGMTCHISTGGRHTRIRPWTEVRDTLEAVGQYIFTAVSGARDSRARDALELWRRREQHLMEKELDLTTGLSAAARNQLQNMDWRSTEIRAVARMSSGTVIPADREEFLIRIAATSHRETPELDRLSALIRAEFQETGPPHEQGYWAAGRLRRELGADEQKIIEPRKCLERWGVLIEQFNREGCPVEAVTAWGVHHGPVIIINESATSRAGHVYGQRATLAHEIAHLILDRAGAMPAGEVLGGRAPEYPEKRARAFAAEFLLPRKTAEAAVRSHASLNAAAQYLQKTFRVSTELLAWQINNSNARMILSEVERIRLEHWKTGRWELPE